MALDIIARAAAAGANSAASAAQTAAAGALAAAAPPFLFTAIGSKTIDTGISTVISSGYSATGKGAGCYVSDSLATASLATAHPRFCKQSANGCYFRLVPLAHSIAICVEQGGASGLSATNDQPAIQATIDYAIATGISEVQFAQRTYTAKPNTRVEGGFGNINPTGNMIEIDGSLAPAPFKLKLMGLAGGTTIRKIGYNTGGSPDTDYQMIAGNPHRGGGIQLYGTQNDDPGVWNMDNWAIQCFEMENITIDGGRTAGGKTANSSDTSDKGIFTFNAVRKIVLRNGSVENFGHELLYGGGGGYGSGTLYPMEVVLENFNALHSNHSCLNFQDANMIVIGGEFGDAYIAAEQYGNDSKFIGTVFRDAGNMNYSAADRSLIAGEGYNWPGQSAVLRKTTLVGVVHRNVDFVYFGAYTDGTADCIDSQINLTGFNCDLRLNHVIDRGGNQTATVLTGPGAVPSGTSTGMLPRNLNVSLTCGATPYAINAGYVYSSIMQFSGYLDPDTCVFRIAAKHKANYALTANGTQKAMPRVIWESWCPTNETTQPIPGISLGGVGSWAIDATAGGWTAYPAGTAGGENITFNTLGAGGQFEGYAQGQEFFFRHGNAAGRFNFAKNGTGMALTRDRVCFKAGDTITFVYDKKLAAWVDAGGYTSDTLTGSATYNAPSIAAGGSTTTTVTVNGAAIGDLADASLGISTAGLILTASVTAANTVTVVLANLTGAAVDLASATLSVIVTRR